MYKWLLFTSNLVLLRQFSHWLFLRSRTPNLHVKILLMLITPESKEFLLLQWSIWGRFWHYSFVRSTVTENTVLNVWTKMNQTFFKNTERSKRLSNSYSFQFPVLEFNKSLQVSSFNTMSSLGNFKSGSCPRDTPGQYASILNWKEHGMHPFCFLQ